MTSRQLQLGSYETAVIIRCRLSAIHKSTYVLLLHSRPHSVKMCSHARDCSVRLTMYNACCHTRINDLREFDGEMVAATVTATVSLIGCYTSSYNWVSFAQSLVLTLSCVCEHGFSWQKNQSNITHTWRR